jgi:predicted amidohydrolase
MVKIGIIQHAPVHMDLTKSMEKAISLIEEASQKGAEIILFGETWLTGYPAWLDYSPDVGLWDNEPMKRVYTRMVQNSILVPGEETKQFGEIARALNVTIGMGINERIGEGFGNGSLFNGLIIISPSGEIEVHHRKLMPTFTEKLLYGLGDGKGLVTYTGSFGSLGGLICWEHWMPHARQALHNSGEQIHLALWPSVHEIHQIASRHYAFEGRCFVIAIGQMMKVKDIPEQLTIPDTLLSIPEKFILNGGSCIIGPNGKFILEPKFDVEEIIIAEIDLQDTIGEKMTLDTAGHYYRPDVFTFEINRRRPE